MVCSTRALFTPIKHLNIYSDIKATTAVLTTAASILALSSLVFSVALMIDWIRYLCSPQPKLSVKEGDDEETFTSPGRLPFSTRTLGLQTVTLSFLTVWLLAVLIPSTVFVRTRSAHLTIQTTVLMSLPSVDTKYWDYGFRNYSTPSTISYDILIKRSKCDAWEQRHGSASFSHSRQASLLG
jgi:hypothetical protein